MLHCCHRFLVSNHITARTGKCVDMDNDRDTVYYCIVAKRRLIFSIYYYQKGLMNVY